MDWTKFNTHGESPNHAFEVLCNILFQRWCKREYKSRVFYNTTVNGSGGDGGVEAFSVLEDQSIVAVQSKWFRETIGTVQIEEIKRSIITAITVRPTICRYIVCVPRDLSSKKIGKGRKSVQFTEESRWLSLVDTIAEIKSDLVLELWNETRLVEELQYIESTGTRLYYFDNCEITENVIKTSFDKAVAGWARTKYVPDLYTPGYIHEHITNYIRNDEINNKALQMTAQLTFSLENLEKAICHALTWINEHDSTNLLKDYLEEDYKSISSVLLPYFKKLLPLIKSGKWVDIKTIRTHIRFACSDEVIQKSQLEHKSYFHIHNIRSAIHKVHEDYGVVENVLSYSNDNRIIFTGGPGTGKTAGIVAEIHRLFEENIHIPILIHAREYSEGNTWKDILSKTLGLNSSWSEDNLFQVLESSAFAKEKRHNSDRTDENAKVCSKVVICVDGLDESMPYEFWTERINEAEAYKSIYNNIVFIFLTRPYALNCQLGTDLLGITKRLPLNGDADLDTLFELYVNHYNISLADEYWIRGVLTSPFSIKLFCDIFQGQTIERNYTRNSLIITRLISKKIEMLENEYVKESKQIEEDNLIQKTLINLSVLFTSKNRINFEDIESVLNGLTRQSIKRILVFLEKQGIIYSYVETLKNPFIISKTFYTWGMQPTLDYLVACKLFESLNNGDTLGTEYDQGILQMLSLIVLENKHRLLFTYKDQIPMIDDYDLFETMCYALSNTSPEIAAQHKEYVFDLLKKNPDNFRILTNRIILPASRIKHHPLGANLFDEFLNQFELPAIRDIWVSVPSNLFSGFGEDWYCSENIDLNQIVLKSKADESDYPLIACWLLASVENEVRNKMRIQLTGWGMNNPDSFLCLFFKCISINDPQIREDLMSVAYGISLSQFITDQYLSILVKWIIKNVFSESGLLEFYDADIRYYCRGIVDIAINKKIITEEEAQACIPPYKKTLSVIPISKEAVKSNRMGGYGPIDYDLARYVLCDHIHSDFFHSTYDNGNNDLITEARRLLDNHKQFYDLEELSVDGFIISAAYQYIIDNGWTKDRFVSMRGHKGIDNAIRSSYYSATHGEQSAVMTVAEKYVWCAKAKLVTFFADSLPLHNCEEGFHMLDDYSELKNYRNPYQDWINECEKKYPNPQPWLHTETMAIPLKDAYTKDSIIEWMVNSPLPDFENWILENGAETLLYTFTSINNNRNGISELINISSGLILSDNMEALINLIDNDTNWQNHELINVEDFQSHQKGACYCTPQEACVVNSRKEIYNKLLLSDGSTTIDLYKALTRCITRIGIDEEKEYKIPSQMLREILGISYGDGYVFTNKQGKTVCRYTERKDSYSGAQYNLLADRNILRENLSKTMYKMFWLFRICRRQSYLASERFQDINKEADHTFLVWFDDTGKCQSKQISDSGTDQSWNLPFKQYSSLVSTYMPGKES